MVERRSLKEGITSTPLVDPQREKDFVYGTKAASGDLPSAPAPGPAPGTGPGPGTGTAPKFSRVALSTRIRRDYAEALKRASLERQLGEVEPSTHCEILEQALEPWLRANGYIQ